MPATRYFLTGALGCIGAWVVKALLDRGDEVVVFDSARDDHRLTAILDDEARAAMTFVNGNVTDGAAVNEALERSGAARIIHLAGLQVPTCRANPPLGAMVNVVGTLNVFEAARGLGLRRVVYASSAAVFGLSDEAVDETVTPEPLTHYGVFKQANEGNARVYFRDHGVSSVGLRPFSVYGVGRDAGITSDPTRAMKAALVGRPFHIRFGGVTDFIYVADTAAAFIACADRGPDGAHVFNVHGETIAVADIVALIEQHLPTSARGLITFGGPKIPMPPALDDTALRSAVEGLPRTTAAAGIAETIARFTALRDAGRLDTSDIDEPAPVPAR
jgi:nucleoside-diphosphate-sugar epimerase